MECERWNRGQFRIPSISPETQPISTYMGWLLAHKRTTIQTEDHTHYLALTDKCVVLKRKDGPSSFDYCVLVKSVSETTCHMNSLALTDECVVLK